MSDNPSKLQGKAAEFAEVLRDHLPELRDRYGVESLGIFGSYLREEESAGSDLDILVEFARTPDLLQFVELKLLLSDVLAVDVDLVMKRALKPRIGKRILAEVVQV